MPHNKDDKKAVALIRDAFPRNLANAISSFLGASVQVTISAERLADIDLWYETTLSSGGSGALRFGSSRQLWFKLGRRILAAMEENTEDEELISSTLREISSQTMNALITELNSQYKKQIEVRSINLADSANPSVPVFASIFYDLRTPDGLELPVSVTISPQLVTLLAPLETQEATPSKVERPFAPGAKLPIPAGYDAKKLDLLLDVEVPVSISMGRAQMPLKEVVKLTTGSVVELSRNVSEPVDIVVNNCIVARGEVVVVDGNFGVRIKEVLSKEERLKRIRV